MVAATVAVIVAIVSGVFSVFHVLHEEADSYAVKHPDSMLAKIVYHDNTPIKPPTIAEKKDK